jgi:hypothetical protein
MARSPRRAAAVADRPAADTTALNGHAPMPPLIEVPPDLVAAPPSEAALVVPPGLASADTDDYSVPFEAQFAGRNWMPATGLALVGAGLVSADEHLKHLRGVTIDYLWRRRGGTSRGAPKIGDCQGPGGLTEYYAGRSVGARVTYVVWLAADHVREFKGWQIEAALYRQLLKTDYDPEDDDAYRVRGPDFVGFIAEIERYGLWSKNLLDAGSVMRQARIPDDPAGTSEQAALPEGDDSDT